MDVPLWSWPEVFVHHRADGQSSFMPSRFYEIFPPAAEMSCRWWLSAAKFVSQIFTGCPLPQIAIRAEAVAFGSDLLHFRIWENLCTCMYILYLHMYVYACIFSPPLLGYAALFAWKLISHIAYHLGILWCQQLLDGPILLSRRNAGRWYCLISAAAILFSDPLQILSSVSIVDSPALLVVVVVVAYVFVFVVADAALAWRRLHFKCN